jgi:hypothetical protein
MQIVMDFLDNLIIFLKSEDVIPVGSTFTNKKKG